MNYYAHHIGDYARDTAHLTMLEDAAYRRMLDLYYASERPLPGNRAGLYRLVRARTKDERAAVDTVLLEYFVEINGGGWANKRADAEIAEAQVRIAAAQKNGKKGGRPRKPKTNPLETQSVSNISEHANPSQSSQSPISNLQSPIPLPSGNGAKRVDPVKSEIWASGKALLEAQGVDAKAAGEFLGKLCKDYGNVLVLQAVRDAVTVTPVEAKAWLMARCQERRKPGGVEARNADAVKKFLEGGDAIQ